MALPFEPGRIVGLQAAPTTSTSSPRLTIRTRGPCSRIGLEMFGTKVVSFVAGARELIRSLTLSLPARPVRDGRFGRRARWPPIIRAERAARTHSKLWAKYCLSFCGRRPRFSGRIAWNGPPSWSISQEATA